ncbi:hypothetical protein [Sinorhizobium meliloti]|uniref:hypothetical protein n=1 Tax=Rhizobium meliloti TaxID=382 RepID=UPI000B4A2925|nr:hypothetical protein [Sinorhizobium meliloti]ASP66417.1 hypothetical protein CDO29_17380 [Sinorhizobium meliloti]MQX01618.1 hypothetical protein [Sinorhizobium meliloti]RVK39516.1 hypothetical protein CN160_34915 [Sinorhizobium meliloti]
MRDIKDAHEGYMGIAEKIAKGDMIEPVSVCRFVEGSPRIGERTPEQWQTDAFGQVHAWMTARGLAKWRLSSFSGALNHRKSCASSP